MSSPARDLQEVLSDHAHVAECVVAELADDLAGEAVTAFVVMVNDVRSDLDAVWEHVRERLPRAGWPREVHVVDRLPADPAAEAARRRNDAPDDGAPGDEEH